jgi:hypothetical protein
MPAEYYLLTELEAWRALPVAGGYLDQPVTLMLDLATVRRAIHSKRVAEQRKANEADRIEQLRQKALKAAGGGL